MFALICARNRPPTWQGCSSFCKLLFTYRNSQSTSLSLCRYKSCSCHPRLFLIWQSQVGCNDQTIDGWRSICGLNHAGHHPRQTLATIWIRSLALVCDLPSLLNSSWRRLSPQSLFQQRGPQCRSSDQKDQVARPRRESHRICSLQSHGRPRSCAARHYSSDKLHL